MTVSLPLRTGVLMSVLLLSTFSPLPAASPEQGRQKIGVLLANHGSRSATWRNALTDLEAGVRDRLLAVPGVTGVKTAFMEYNEPSIATRMKEFDAEGYTDVIIVPVFLTVSAHTFDDIPTILGRKTDPHSLELLKIERIERYTPKASTVIAPTLDFTALLKENIVRRAAALSADAKNEGLVLIAYGDAQYEREWIELMNAVGEHVKKELGIASYAYGWCGHIAHYDPQRTTDAIGHVLAKKEKAVVVPVLVAHDEMFQVKIIGDGIAAVPDHRRRVAYRPDSILPDPAVERWIVDAVLREASGLRATTSSQEGGR